METDAAMAGAVQDILIVFKNNCNARPDNDVDRALLLQNIDNIAWLTGYIAAHYIAIRKQHLQHTNQDFNRYYKVRITTKAYHVKPDDLNQRRELCLVFDNERIINRFDPRGVPWGFTTPRQAYKMAAGACRRAVSDTSLNQSGFSYHKMHSVRISIYETLGIVAGSLDSDMDDDEDEYKYDINQFIDDRSIVADDENEEDNYIAEKEIAQVKKTTEWAFNKDL